MTRPNADGEHVSDKFAVVEKSLEFTFVPWTADDMANSARFAMTPPLLRVIEQ
jgi:hypothetical protein